MKINRINNLFTNKKRDILSVYFCAGYPQAENTSKVIKSLEENGIDMIEIGIPFSDPMADGKVIQDAATKALHNGMSLKLLFSQIKDIRNEVSIPLLLMGYLNPIMQYGFENFFGSCRACGIDGCIIPDLPFNDYVDDIKPIADKYGIKVIMLITPETTQERIRKIDALTDGFIYMVSSASTTGAKESFDADVIEYFDRINAMGLSNPRLIGFGISNSTTFETACNRASGAIIGSRFVTLLGKLGDADMAAKELKKLIKG